MALTLDATLDDEVFVSPRTDNGNDLFSTGNLEIFGYGSPRTPAGVLLNGRGESTITLSVKTEKHRDKGGTDCADGTKSDDDAVSILSNHYLLKKHCACNISLFLMRRRSYQIIHFARYYIAAFLLC